MAGLGCRFGARRLRFGESLEPSLSDDELFLARLLLEDCQSHNFTIKVFGERTTSSPSSTSPASSGSFNDSNLLEEDFAFRFGRILLGSDSVEEGERLRFTRLFVFGDFAGALLRRASFSSSGKRVANRARFSAIFSRISFSYSHSSLISAIFAGWFPVKLKFSDEQMTELEYTA